MINHHIDADRGRIEIQLRGQTSVQEVFDFMDNIESQIPPEIPFQILVDAVNSDASNLTVADMDRFAQVSNSSAWSPQITREAIVATTEQNMGLAVLFQGFNTTQKKSRLFKDREAAERWLDAEEE